MMWFLFFIFVVADATVYVVGPNAPYTQIIYKGQAISVQSANTFTSIGGVPFYTLAPGDIVYIIAKPSRQPYREKILVSTVGTSTQRISVIGIPDQNGNLPIIDGANATQSTLLRDRWGGGSGAQYSEALYVVGISLQSGNNDIQPAYIDIANLEITGGSGSNYFTDENGVRLQYGEGASGIRIFCSKYVRIIGCNVHGNDDGVFAKPSEYFGKTEFLELYNNSIWGNGVPESFLYHNTYIESDRAIYSGNYYGGLVDGAYGSDLKDRSAGTVISYNYFASPASRFIDLVEPQDGYNFWGNSIYYGVDFVYGNIFFQESDSGPIHYGGDQYDNNAYRTRTLYFYHNTYVYISDITDAYKQYLFQVDTNTAVIDVRNNVFAFLPRTSGSAHTVFYMTASSNTDNQAEGQWIFGVNWVPDDWSMSIDTFRGNTTGTNNFIVAPANNGDPGFFNVTQANLVPRNNSALVGVGAPLSPAITSNILGGDFTPNMQYVPGGGYTSRSSWGAGSDIGALWAGTVTSTFVTTGRAASTSSGFGTGSDGTSTGSTTSEMESSASVITVSLLLVFFILL